MSAQMPFYDDRQVAIEALVPIVGAVAAEAFVQAIDEIAKEIRNGSWKATQDDHGGAADAPGAIAAAIARAASPRDPADDAGAAEGPGAGVVIPDHISPLVGWRAWKVRGSGRPMLTSIHREDAWAPGVPFVASCDVPKRRHVPHSCRCELEQAPATNCRCGVYAARDLPNLDANVRGAPGVLPDEILVVGRVALWGRAIEYERGWRAQFAYPQAFYVGADGRTNTAAMELLTSFNVPVLDVTDLQPLGWSEDPRDPDQEDSATDWRREEFAGLVVDPRLDPALAATPLDYDLAVRIFGDDKLTRSHACVRFLAAASRYGLTTLGQVLALSNEDFLRLPRVGMRTAERLRAWRLSEGLSDFPQTTARTDAHEKQTLSTGGPQGSDPQSSQGEDTALGWKDDRDRMSGEERSPWRAAEIRALRERFADVTMDPLLDPALGATPMDRELAIRIFGNERRGDTRTGSVFCFGAQDAGLGTLGLVLALSREDLLALWQVGPSIVERFRAWRIAEGLGDFPETTLRGTPL